MKTAAVNIIRAMVLYFIFGAFAIFLLLNSFSSRNPFLAKTAEKIKSEKETEFVMKAFILPAERDKGIAKNRGRGSRKSKRPLVVKTGFLFAGSYLFTLAIRNLLKRC